MRLRGSTGHRAGSQAGRRAGGRSRGAHAHPGLGRPTGQRARERADRRCRGSAQPRHLDAPGAHAAELRQREHQSVAGESLSAGHHLPRLHGFTAARHVARALGLPGRRAHQRTLRRWRELGPDPQPGDREHHPDSGLQPGVRSQHPGRRALGHDQERFRLSGTRRYRAPAALFGARPGRSSTAVTPTGSATTRPAMRFTSVAGATTRAPTSGRGSANSAFGIATPAWT